AEVVGYDYPRIAERRDAVVNQLYKGVQYLMKKNKIEVVQGKGRVSDRNTISVDSKQVKGKNLIIATGSVVKNLPGLEIDGESIISSDHAVRSKSAPESICIIGAGAVGVEFASVYERFGSQVTIVEMLPHLLPLEDDDISTEFEKSMRRRKVKFLTSAKVEKVEVAGEVVKCTVTTQKGTEVLEAEMFLCAVGRRPVSENLDLEKLPNVKLERGYVVVDPKTLLTGERWLSAIGDVVALP
ncbi:MAG: dihydrolipoyl dehydrogenase, partial [Chloroflexi bacterium]